MANFLSAAVLALVATGLVITVQCDNSEVTTEITGSQIERNTLPLGFNLEYRGLGAPPSVLLDSGANSNSLIPVSNSLPGLTQVNTDDTTVPTTGTGLTSPTETTGPAMPISTSTVDQSAAIAMQEGGTSIDSGTGFSSLANGSSQEGFGEVETLTSSAASLEKVVTPYTTPVPASKTMDDEGKLKDSDLDTVPPPVPSDMTSEEESSDSGMKKGEKSVTMEGSKSEEETKMKGSQGSGKDEEDEEDENEQEKEEEDATEEKSKSSGSRKLLFRE